MSNTEMATISIPLLILISTTMATAAPTSDSGELWCVAKNNAEDAALQTAIDWACGPGGADCKAIQQGGACYDPNDIQSHASYAFNDYYVKNGFAQSACQFDGTAALTSLDPSQGSCKYPSSSSARNGSFTGSSSSGLTSSSSADTSAAGHSVLQLRTLFVSLVMTLLFVDAVLR